MMRIPSKEDRECHDGSRGKRIDAISDNFSGSSEYFLRSNYEYYLLVYMAIMPSNEDFRLVFWEFTFPTRVSMVANCFW